MSRRRLGYLLKHAQLRLAELTGPALAPYGIDGRELAVLSVLETEPETGPRTEPETGPRTGPGTGEPLSQQEAAQRLRIDRTTMVAMIDALEAKGLVARRPHPGDRRKNAVELTPRGRDTLRDGGVAVDGAERAFLSGLTDDDASLLRDVLSRLV
ncbi:MarR family transcriptional regulator [Nonomuraea sp. NPDC000554]|uniref:MarR family winged helix-turn-helix transcriptional regulator n=1 Tax=Nonomuraea sp. NPDC000554 TaxID=3154259 RepID=UPI0033190076